MNPAIDLLRGELERLFTLDELVRMSENLLGLASDDVGGAAAKGSFALALTERCLEGDRIDALVDVVVHARKGVDPRVRDVAALLAVANDELAPGAVVGPFTVDERIGRGDAGLVYRARRGSDAYALTILPREIARDRRSVQRFLTANRLVATVEHRGIPRGLEAGELAPGVFYVAHRHVAGEALSARMARSGPTRFGELGPILEGILEPLASLHAADLTHGALQPESVFVSAGAENGEASDEPRVTLVGFATDRLGGGLRSARHGAAPETILGGARGGAGAGASSRSDVYAFGALLYELVSGTPVFDGLDAALAHLSREPESVSRRAPAGWVSADVDALIAACLEKDAARRPRDAGAVLEIVRRALALARALGDEQHPGTGTSTHAAAVRAGAKPAEIAASLLAEAAAAGEPRAQGRLLREAARVFDAAGLREPSENAYAELVEILLAESQSAAPGEARGQALAEIGRLYATDLDDPEQAVVAFTQALCEDPSNDGYAAEVERLSGANLAAWAEQLEAVEAALAPPLAKNLSPSAERALTLRAARWYDAKLGRVERALAAYRRVLAVDPGNEAASDGATSLLRRMKQWPELATALVGQAATASSQPRARELRTEAAEIFETKLGDPDRARELYAAILADDPGHVAASEGLARIAERAGDFRALAVVLDRRAESRRGAARVEALLKAAEVYADHLDELPPAAQRYEAALAIEPTSAAALRGLDRVLNRSGRHRELVGVLARQIELSPTPRQKINLYERLAAVEEQEFLDHGAAARAYEQILALDPGHGGALEALARLRETTGDAQAALEALEALVKKATTPEAKRELGVRAARLWADLAKARHREAGDFAEAEAAARRALELDPTNAGGLLVLADLAFDAGRIGEAAAVYDGLLERPSALGDDAVRVLARAAEAAFASASVPGARAYALHRELWAKQGAALEGRERAALLHRLGESARRAGDVDAAVDALEEAEALDPADGNVAIALARAYDAREDWARAVDVRRRALSAPASGGTATPLAEEARFDLLLEIGDIFFAKLADRTEAARAYTLALEVRPSDRNLLTKLMQLYSEQEQWEKVCDVVLRLADFVEDPRQRAKYMHTAATIAARSLGDAGRSLKYYRRALEFDPSLERAAAEAIELHEARGEHEDVERLLKALLENAKARSDRDEMARILDRLGGLYRERLHEPDLAIDAYEAAHAFDPDGGDSVARQAVLAELYAANPAEYGAKAIALHAKLLRRDPYRIESYKTLERLYAGAGRVDAAWCLCQALSLLRRADADEEQLYLKHRASSAAPMKSTLGAGAWATLMHWDLDPLLTRIFALIEPVVVRARTKPLEEYGYHPDRAIDCATHQAPFAQTLYYAQGVLALPPPLVFEDLDDPGTLGMVHAQTPAIVVGQGAMGRGISNQAMAFCAGRHLTSYRPGFYVRHLVPTGTGLKAWLFAAIKLVVPAFAIPSELAGQVDEAIRAMAADFVGIEKERLASAVSKLLQAGGALDLKKWVAAIDLTRDRVGMVLAHDLQIATEAVRSTEKDASVALKERMKDLVLFSVSEDYFALRGQLGIAV